MFSFFRRSAKGQNENAAQNPIQKSAAADTALIAVISAAIARFRETEGGSRSETGFVVRRVRRI